MRKQQETDQSMMGRSPGEALAGLGTTVPQYAVEVFFFGAGSLDIAPPGDVTCNTTFQNDTLYRNSTEGLVLSKPQLLL